MFPPLLGIGSVGIPFGGLHHLSPRTDQLLPLQSFSTPILEAGSVMYCPGRSEVGEIVEIIWDRLIMFERF